MLRITQAALLPYLSETFSLPASGNPPMYGMDAALPVLSAWLRSQTWSVDRALEHRRPGLLGWQPATHTASGNCLLASIGGLTEGESQFRAVRRRAGECTIPTHGGAR